MTNKAKGRPGEKGVTERGRFKKVGSGVAEMRMEAPRCIDK